MTRNITNSGAAGEGAGQDLSGQWRDIGADVRAELEAVLGPVGGDWLAAELADLQEGPPWHPVAAGESAGLVAAYRLARLVVDELRVRLAGAGIAEGDVPGLCASVDADGLPVVVFGTLSAATAQRLAGVLAAVSDGRTDPPAGGGRDAGRAA